MNRSPSCLKSRLTFEDDLCDGVLGRVRDREMGGARPRCLVDFEDTTTKEKERRARIARGDFDILPGDAARPACLQGFERGFFGGKARSVMLRGDHPATIAVGAFLCRINALDKARRAEQDLAHAMDFDDVYTDGNNH